MFDSREDINRYLGFRHVTGVKEWSLLAKARYLRTLLPENLHTYNESVLKKLAKAIGSRSDYVVRLLVAYDLFLEIEKNNFYHISNLSEDTIYFNYLVDSIRRPNVRAFIGVELNSDEPLYQLINEISYSENFERLINWFFKANLSGKTVLKADSDSLSKLNKVLGNLEARDHFVKNEELNEAYDLLDQTHGSFSFKLNLSLKNIKESMSQLYLIENKDISDIETLESIQRIAGIIIDTVNKLPE